MKKKLIYRLGDVVRTQYFHMDTSLYTDGKYKNTIAGKYMQSTAEKNNFDLLNEIVHDFEKKLQIKKPTENEWVVHIRLGDVLEKSKHSVEEHFENEIRSEGNGISDSFYIKPKIFFLNRINKMKKLGITKVIICSKFHKAEDSHKKSSLYLENVIELFKRNGFEVNLRVGKFDADEDFTFLVNSKYFTSTGGGFSLFASKLIELRGNNNI